MAEALAAHESVNFKIEQLKIEASMRIDVAAAVAQVMSNLGTNAKFVHIGGNGGADGKSEGNILLDTLMGVPSTLFKGDVLSDAMNNGSTLPADITRVVQGILGKTEQPAEEQSTHEV
jgi:hypothetical protein